MRTESTLNEILMALGYTTRNRGRTFQGKHILAKGRVVFGGTASEMWEWLREADLLFFAESECECEY